MLAACDQESDWLQLRSGLMSVEIQGWFACWLSTQNRTQNHGICRIQYLTIRQKTRLYTQMSSCLCVFKTIYLAQNNEQNAVTQSYIAVFWIQCMLNTVMSKPKIEYCIILPYDCNWLHCDIFWGENLHVSPVYIIICWWYYEYYIYIYICFIYLIWCGGKVALSKLYRSVSVQTELIFIQLKGRRIEHNTSWTTLILVIHGGIGLLPYRDLTIWEQHKATTQGCSRGWYDWYLYVLCGHPGVYAFHCSTGLRIGHVIFGEWENGKPSSKTPTLGKKILCMSIDRRPLKLFWSIDTSNFGNRMKVGRAIACLCIHGIVDVSHLAWWTLKEGAVRATMCKWLWMNCSPWTKNTGKICKKHRFFS